MAAKSLPPLNVLRKLLVCDPERGTLHWRHRPAEMFSSARIWKSWNSRLAGKSATVVGGNGYACVQFNGRRYYAHRLIWKMHYGCDPKGSIDHINRDRLDNRIENLREGTHAQNMINQPKQAGASSQYFGVYKSSNAPGWCAQIVIASKTKYLGYFQEELDAARAYDAAATKIHGKWARLNFPEAA